MFPADWGCFCCIYYWYGVMNCTYCTDCYYGFWEACWMLEFLPFWDMFLYWRPMLLPTDYELLLRRFILVCCFNPVIPGRFWELVPKTLSDELFSFCTCFLTREKFYWETSVWLFWFWLFSLLLNLDEDCIISFGFDICF